MALSSKADKKILKTAKKNFKLIVDQESEQRIQMKDDRRFYLGDQWQEGVRAEREQGNFIRPTITVNRVKQFINYVANQQRQNKPQVKVIPKDSGAQEKYAENRSGLIKHILNDSKATLAHQKMFEDALIEGRGHCIVNTEFVSDRSHDQKIVIDIVKSSRDVYMDIAKKEPDYSDCKHGFHLDRISRDAYKEEYPKFPVMDWGTGIEDNHWIGEKEIVIAQYFLQEEHNDTLLTFSMVVEGEETEPITKLLSELDEDPRKNSNFVVSAERKTKRKQWMWYLINDEHILDRRELVCKSIPIVTTIDVEDFVDGRPVIKGEVRDLKDLGRMYNFYKSQQTEIIGQSPKSPYIVAMGQIEGVEEIWANANNSPTGFLPYKPIVNGTTPVPPPQRIPPPQVPVAYVQAMVDIIEDMKAVSGLQAANFGGRANETSGVALREKKASGDLSNYHLPDNFTNALTHEGIVINQMLTTYYPIGTIVNIMGKEDEVKTKQMGEKELGEEFSLGEGEFGIISTVGPSFATQRQEASENMIDMARYVPAIGQAAPDIIVKATDWPMKDKIAERAKQFLKATIPQMSLEDQDEGPDRESILENQLQQMQQVNQQQQEQMQQMQEVIQKTNQRELEVQEAKIDNDMQNTQIKAQEVQNNAQFKQEELRLKEFEIKTGAMTVDLVEDTKKEIAAMNHGSAVELKNLDSRLLPFDRTDEVKAQVDKISNDQQTKLDKGLSSIDEKQSAAILKLQEQIKMMEHDHKTKEPKQPANVPSGDIIVNANITLPEKKGAKITKTDKGYTVEPDE